MDNTLNKSRTFQTVYKKVRTEEKQLYNAGLMEHVEDVIMDRLSVSKPSLYPMDPSEEYAYIGKM